VKRSLLALIVLALSCVSGVHAQQPVSQAVVPNLIKFGGHLVDSSGVPYSTTAGVTFGLYKDQQGGQPLWMETQNVQPDQSGRYTVFLGSMTTNGLPLELFSDGEARWLGVQVEGKPEQPRVLLVAVPYALKAADAETLGGKPASAFALAAPNTPSGTTSQTGTGTVTPSLSGQTGQAAITGQGATNYLPIWKSNMNLGSSTLYQMNGNVGISTTSPAAKLDVNGATILQGLLTLSPPGAWALKMTGSAFTISNTGIVTFASGQTFPGAGTISGVTAGTDLTGGGTSGAVTLNVDITKVPQLNTSNSFTGNQSVTGNVTATGSVSGGAGTFTGLVSAEAGALLPASAQATQGQGINSQPLDLVASAYNSSGPPPGAQNQDFQWLAEPVGNNTSSPSGKLDLLFGANGATPTETGLNIASNGQITFAPGQTFPGGGGGTVTSVGSGAGLTSSPNPITTSGTISVANGGITNAMLANPSTTIATGTGLTGGGTVALGGTLNLGLNQVPFLNVNNAFTGTITATYFYGDGSNLANVTATNAFNLGGLPASNYAQGSGAQGVLAEWTGTTPPYTVGNSPITDSGGTLTSTEPISAPSITSGTLTSTGPISAPSVSTSGTGAGVVTISLGATNVTWTLGSGVPNTPCVVGSLYSRIDGGAQSTLYVCEGTAQGTGTWTPK
jgi:hypothetical protein